MPGDGTLILVQRENAVGPLRRLASSMPSAETRSVTFAPLTGDVQAELACRRERHGGAPLGALVNSEATVLAALNGGADEAAVLGALDPALLNAFVDRLLLRARLRGESQQLREAFVHAERLTALGTLVAGVGHEINNPLTAMQLSIDVARRYVLPAWHAAAEVAFATRKGQPLPQTALETLLKVGGFREQSDTTNLFEDLSSATDTIATIARDLRVFARAEEETPEIVDVPSLVDQALRVVGRELSHQALIERDYMPTLPRLVVPRNRVVQVLINLLINAAHAMRDVERLVHKVRVGIHGDEEFVAITISDTGPGIPADILDRIFDPFFTTKRALLGTGLGLSISRSILRRIGGDLSVESIYGDGATFVCLLPVPAADTVRHAEVRRSLIPDSRSPCLDTSVLVVEDDERVLRSVVRLLNPNHRVIIAQDGREALEMLETGTMPDALLLELALPDVDGRTVLEWVAQNRPELQKRTLVLTSAGVERKYETFLRNYRGPVLHKPVRADALLSAVASLDWVTPPSRR